MSNRKRIKEVEHNADAVRLATQRFNIRIGQLEHELRCEHKYVKWEEINIAGCCVEYRKRCLNCDKILEHYVTKKEWLDAQYREVPERERRARDIIDPLTGMDERTRQLAEDYVVCLKKNVMDEEKAREILRFHIIHENNIISSVLHGNLRWQPGEEEVHIRQASLRPDYLKALAWWMENKGKVKP